ARRLRERLAGETPVLEQSGEGTALMEAWKGARTVILIDALQSDGVPGAVRRIEAGGSAIPAQSFRCSSHLFGIAESIELARVMGELPSRLILFGIEGKTFGFGETLSSEVAHGVAQAVEQVIRELESI
ncbi:MAG: hydrogenase maturation protease, partial [Nitrospinae bacterium CG11_big_fil_rev_8_21_14_0_20_56_8]